MKMHFLKMWCAVTSVCARIPPRASSLPTLVASARAQNGCSHDRLQVFLITVSSGMRRPLGDHGTGASRGRRESIRAPMNGRSRDRPTGAEYGGFRRSGPPYSRQHVSPGRRLPGPTWKATQGGKTRGTRHRPGRRIARPPRPGAALPTCNASSVRRTWT